MQLLKYNVDFPLSLYVGEAGCIAARCGKHLSALYKNPAYFGLTESDLKNDELILKFSVLEEIKEDASVIYRKRAELQQIQKLHPLTQLRTSDRQLRDKDKLVQKVQEAMKCPEFQGQTVCP